MGFNQSGQRRARQPQVGFCGSFVVKSSVVETRKNFEAGALDFKAIESAFAPFAAEIEAMPDSVTLTYGSQTMINRGRDRDREMETVNDQLLVEMTTCYGEPVRKSLSLPVGKRQIDDNTLFYNTVYPQSVPAFIQNAFKEVVRPMVALYRPTPKPLEKDM